MSLFWFGANANAELIPTRDYHQCERRCQAEFGGHQNPGSIKAIKVNDNLCRCLTTEDKTLGVIARKYPINPPHMGQEVCGLDGKTYSNVAAADAAQVLSIHGGACGQCSNLNDIQMYYKTRNTLTQDTTQCALKLVAQGDSQARSCFAAQGFTQGCNECWVMNMECTRVHCFTTCMLSRLRGEPNIVDGKLNDCLKCDEDHCGTPFIECAGANRRRAGIRSDIGRPGEEIWKRPHPVPGVPDGKL